MISVIVPIYNSEKYMKKCIDSILSQTYSNFELILVDDGSTDDSSNICDEYSSLDERVIVIHKKNGGVSSARNRGIKEAKGDYISFVDSDDYLDDNFLSMAIKNIKNVDMYLSGLSMEFFEDEKIIKTINYNQSKSEIMNIQGLFNNLELTYPQICICGPWCKLYITKIIKTNNLLFDESISLGEDTLFNLNYFKFVKKVYFDQNSYYHYRRGNSESLFSKYNANIYEIHIKVYDKMRKLMNEKKCSQESMKRFENLYTSLLIGCIHHVFRFSKKRTDRINVINKVVNNECIKYFAETNNFKNKIIVYCIKRKKKNMLFLIFSIKYLI